MIYRPKVARDAASILTDAQAEAIEGKQIVAPDWNAAAWLLLAAMGIELEREGGER